MQKKNTLTERLDRREYPLISLQIIIFRSVFILFIF